MAKSIWTTPNTVCIGDQININNLWEEITTILEPATGETNYTIHTSSMVFTADANTMLEIS